MTTGSPRRDPPGPRLWQSLFAPIDIASLAVFRIGFGLLMAWSASDTSKREA